MSTYTVTISQRPLGVRFAHFQNDKHEMVAGLQQVLVDSYGHKLGLSAGDILIGINGESVSYLSSSIALQSFRGESLPFTASFQRYKEPSSSPLPSPNTDETESDDDDENGVWMPCMNNNSMQDMMHYNYTSDDDEESLSISNSDNSSVPSDCDTISECSMSFDHDIEESDSKELSPYHATSELAQKLSIPKIQLPYKACLSDTLLATNDDDFDCMYLDDEEEEEEYDTDELDGDGDEIDIYTKDLVNGYLRCFKSQNTTNDDTAICKMQLLTAEYVCNNSVIFDGRAEGISGDDTENIKKVATTSSNGFSFGIHEWSIKILKSDIYRQEIGVIENNKDLHDIQIEKGGISETIGFGARAVYGSELFSNEHYYASYNNDNNARCKKAINSKIGWCQGDIIRIVLNLKHGNIEFFLNGKKVRKKISLQMGRIYHPIIAFSGNFEYELIHYS